DEAGRLVAGPDFIRAYLSRPEMLPPDDACAAERALHADLLAEPFREVGDGDLQRLKDPDARENYGVFLRFRDYLARADSIEAAYLGLFRPDAPGVPTMFVDHLAAAILRDLLHGGSDPFRARAAELFFRVQKARSEEHTSELQSRENLVCRLLLEKK